MNQDTSIPVGLQTLLTELDFISQIQRGDKPIMGDMILVESGEYMKRFKKWWAGETKDTIMSKVEQIVSKTVDAIVAHKKTAYIGLIVNKLSDAREGLAALLITYESYPKTKARINVQLQNIDLQLESYRDLIKGYKNMVNVEEKEEEKIDLDFFDNSSEKRKIRKTRIKKSLDKQS